MTSHNVNIKSLASIALSPEQTVGASVNWSIPDQTRIPADAVSVSVAKHSIPASWVGKPTEPIVQFKFWHYGRRVPRASRKDREIISTPARHNAKELVSFVYSVNVDSEENEKGNLIPVGSVTFDKKSESFWWRFDCGAKQQSETDDEYHERALASMESKGVQASDLTDFAKFAVDTLTDVDLFTRIPHYNGDALRDAAATVFKRLGGYSMSARGGFWYLPRTDGGERCPLTNAESFMAVVEEASDRACRFMRLTMPKDAQTTEMAATFVTDGIAGKLADLRERVSKVEVTRKNQHGTRLEELAMLRADIALYRELLGVVDTELLTGAEEIQNMMEAQIRKFELPDATPAATPGSSADESATADAGADDEPTVDYATIVEETRRAIELFNSAAADLKCGSIVVYTVGFDAEIAIEEDEAFGYLWTTTRSGAVVTTGFTETIAPAVERAVLSLLG
jgi:hypothetical protein